MTGPGSRSPVGALTTMRHVPAGRDAGSLLLGMGAANRGGARVGIYSMCSANRWVLEAGMAQALRDDTIVCIESTCNQVNQDGGYAGLTPLEFRDSVLAIAAGCGLPQNRVVVGGDHLGPSPWRSEPAEQAMAKARELVRDCVAAGYVKIHLDASMRCADDPAADGRLAEPVAVERTAELCGVAERAARALPDDAPRPVYVIGTEVPIPGGELAGHGAPAVTRVDDLESTLSATRDAFRTRGLEAAWDRVLAVVAQPGVEFGDTSVFPYERTVARGLSAHLERSWPLVFEAHSTDYQSAAALRAMVEDHFAVLKVGPWLTFAMREAVYALEAVERELLGDRVDDDASRVRETLRRTMVDDPTHWRAYYAGGADERRLALDFSYSDRSRYYWPRPEVARALTTLVANLAARPIPLTLLSQYLPHEYEAVRDGALANEPVAIIRHRIGRVVDLYAAACGMA